MYMEHPFADSEISGSCSHVAQSPRPPSVLFLILTFTTGSPELVYEQNGYPIIAEENK